MWDHPDIEYETPEEFLNLLPLWIRNLDERLYESNNFLVLDFETTTADKGNPHLDENQLVLAGWWYNGVYKEHYGNELEQEELCKDVESCDFMVSHNAKFELGWLRRCGADVRALPVWCTQVGEYVLRGNRSHLGVSLDASCKRRGFATTKIKVIEKLWALGVETYDIPHSLLSPYCRKDVLLALELFQAQRLDIITSGLLKVQYVRCWLPVVLMDIEGRGMMLDEERVISVFSRVYEEHNELEKKVIELAGGINPSSPKQVREFLFETLGLPTPKRYGTKEWLTDTGEISTELDAIKSLKPRTKKQKDFIKVYLEYKSHSGQLTKYLNKFVDCCESDGGILTANLNQTVTKTHRLSSSGRNYKCQFQNFNREFKPLFTTRNPGWSYVERDYSQLEFIMAVQLGHDEVGYKDIREDRDLHTQTGLITHPGFGELRGDERTGARTGAKRHTFKPLFGGTSGTIVQQEYYAFFKRNYSGITKTQDGWIKECLEHKQFRNPSNGLIFYFPHARVGTDGYIYDSTKIRNIPIQSTATADVVLIGLVLFWHLINSSGLESFIVNTVHDSIETEEHPDERDTIEGMASWALRDGVHWIFTQLYRYPLQVPLSVDTERNTHWSTTPEWEERWLRS